MPLGWYSTIRGASNPDRATDSLYYGKVYRIPTGHPEILDMFDEDPGTVWCWKDERTCGAAQKFESEQKALEAWRADKLVFDVVLA